jgi:hypothetical protein
VDPVPDPLLFFSGSAGNLAPTLFTIEIPRLKSTELFMLLGLICRMSYGVKDIYVCSTSNLNKYGYSKLRELDILPL